MIHNKSFFKDDMDGIASEKKRPDPIQCLTVIVRVARRFKGLSTDNGYSPKLYPEHPLS